MLDKNLIHALVRREDLYCGSAELHLNFGLTNFRAMLNHGFLASTYDMSSRHYELDHLAGLRPETR